MSKTNFESLRVYQLAERLADEIWQVVKGWNQFEKNTVRQQIIRAADNIGVNIVEGSGRGSFQDNRRFIRIARGSLNETQHWLRCEYKRTLLTTEQVEKLKPLINELAPKPNAYLRSVGTAASKQTTDTDYGQRTAL